MVFPFETDVPPQTMFLILAGVGALALILLIWIITLDVKIRRLLRGRDGKSLEGVIRAIAEKSVSLDEDLSRLAASHERTIHKLAGSIRGTGLVRFNALQGAGGNQSFSLALLDESGTGMVISSIYTRERTAVYAKPIVKLQSAIELSDEERAAIEEARAKISR